MKPDESLHFDANKIFHTQETPEGFLRLWIAAAKVGNLKYNRADGSSHVEYVSPEVLRDQRHLASWVGKPITDGHPKVGMVDSENIGVLGKGTILDTYLLDKGYLNHLSIVHDKKLIEKIKDGKQSEASSGYWAGVKKNEDGTYSQTWRRGNHVARVDRARAPGAKFLIDGEEGSDSIIQVWRSDGLDLPPELEDEFRHYAMDFGDELPLIIDLVGKKKEKDEGKTESKSGSPNKEKYKGLFAMTKTIILKVDGVDHSFDLEDQTLYKAIAALSQRVDSLETENTSLDEKATAALINAENLENELAEANQQKDSAIAEKEKLSANLDAANIKLDETKKELEARKDSQPEGQTLQGEQIGKLISLWNQVLPSLRKDDEEFKPDWNLDEKGIKKLYLVSRVADHIKLDEKSDDYIDALWDSFSPELNEDEDENAIAIADGSYREHQDMGGDKNKDMKYKDMKYKDMKYKDMKYKDMGKKKGKSFDQEREEEAQRILQNGYTYNKK